MSNQLPIVLLAFANDRQGTFLRSIAAEQDAITHALRAAEEAGLCKVIVLANASAADIIDQFARYDGRICIFHYGGHADGENLLLSSASGAAANINADNLAEFLRRQEGLRLVFLNGCSTLQQAQSLLDARVEQVIVTDRAINDDAAKSFAGLFYRHLAAKTPVKAAFDKAAAGVPVMLSDDGSNRSLYWDGQAKDDEADGPPWHLYSGAEADLNWNLGFTEGSKLRREVKDLIANSRIEQAIDKMKLLLEGDQDRLNQLVMVEGKYKDMRKKVRLGLIDNREAGTLQAQVSYALIELADEL